MQVHSNKNTVHAGVPLKQAKKVMLMLHGRGASAADILGLSQYFPANDTHFIAPQATNNTWYPYSFLAPVAENEPWLSSAVDLIKEIIDAIIAENIASDQIFLLGFSQGACLTLEVAARHAMNYAGVISFTGGLIGETINPAVYKGDFNGTKIFIGNSNRDPHVPLIRSEQSRELLEKMGASVTLKVYPNMPHTINQDEIDTVNKMFFEEK